MNTYHSPPATTNWAGNITFRPAEVLCPRTIAELQDIVRTSKKIRVVGSRHSFNEIAATDGTWLDLRNLDVPLVFHSRTAAEVPATMRLSEVNKRLAERGLALASIGDIDHQQIGGLIATGTHGSGLEWGTMSDLVTAVKLVNGQGKLVELTHGLELAAARTHLGALGAVVSVTLQTCPAHHLERHRAMMEFRKALNPGFIRAHDHTQLLYLPFTDKMYVRTLNRTESSPSSCLKLTLGRWLESFKENWGVRLAFALSGANRDPARIPELMKKLKSQLKESRDVAPSFFQMTSVRTLKYHELEMALDLDDLPAAFEKVRKIIEDLATTRPASGRYYAHLPVTIRAVKGKPDNLMSPTLGRDTAYISVTSRTTFEGYKRYFKSVEEVLGSRFGARPHWGKRHWIGPGERYPGLAAFRSVCSTLDPDRKFMNAFVETRLFPPPERLKNSETWKPGGR